MRSFPPVSRHGLVSAAFCHLAAALAAGAAVTTCSPAAAQVVLMDQIGPIASYTTPIPGIQSQYFTGGDSVFDSAAIDDFTVGGATTITLVEGVFYGVNGFIPSSFANITAWQVNIYSSVTAAAANLTGDVATATLTPSLVELKTPYGSSRNDALVSIPVSLRLPDAGTFFISIIPSLPRTFSEHIAVHGSTFSGRPSNSNSFTVNPNGGFGFTGNQLTSVTNSAYRVTSADATAAPEAGSLALLLPVLGGIGVVLRRRKQ